MSALSGVVNSPTNSDNDDIAVLSPQATTATVVTNDDDDNEGDDDDDDRSRHVNTSPIGSNDSANRLHYATATVNNNSSSNPRNAGRKKSNPVWEFFSDLRAQGMSGVRCRFCDWTTNDRSPTTMKFHLRRRHDTGAGGLWAMCAEKIAQAPPQQYIKRNRGLIHSFASDGDCSSPTFSNYSVYGAPSMVQQQSTAMLNSLLQQAIKKDYSSTSALSIMSQSPAEVINVVVGNNQCSSSSNSYFPAIKTERSETPASETSSSPTQSTNCHTESMRNSSTFALSDGQSIAQLLQIAAEMDLTFTFNSRRSGEYCFASSNSRTTGGNDNNGKMVVFADLGHELRISERFGPEEIDVELWTKADWQQFLWAVRGKCQKVLKS